MRVIPYNKRSSSIYIRLNLRPCICGCRQININNNKGWSSKGLTCKKCRRELIADTIEELIYMWNTEYLQKFPDKGFINM